jgi:hypothetical protein
MRHLLLLSLAACVVAPADDADLTWLTEGDPLAAPPPPTLQLRVPPLLATQTATFEVRGAAPQDQVRILATAAGTGAGPCPGALGGLCLDLLQPFRQIGAAWTDPSGAGSFDWTVPDRPSVQLCFQAVVIASGTGSYNAVSNSVCATIEQDLLWYATCGDPVCRGWTPVPGMPSCSGVQLGDVCTTDGAMCDFQDPCNRRGLCTDADPTQQPGGCPISRKRHKTDISYLGPDELRTSRDELLGMKLARWRYTWDEPGRRARLGFLIDDTPQSVAVTEDGEQVDLYGYTSLAVAALQAQQREIAALQDRVRALEAERDAAR